MKFREVNYCEIYKASINRDVEYFAQEIDVLKRQLTRQSNTDMERSFLIGSISALERVIAYRSTYIKNFDVKINAKKYGTVKYD